MKAIQKCINIVKDLKLLIKKKINWDTSRLSFDISTQKVEGSISASVVLFRNFFALIYI